MQDLLCFDHDALHHSHRFDWIITDRCFARQHTSVGAVEDRIRNIGNFGARWPLRTMHAFQHLSRNNDRLAVLSADMDDSLLCESCLRDIDFDTEIAGQSIAMRLDMTTSDDPLGVELPAESDVFDLTGLLGF